MAEIAMPQKVTLVAVSGTRDSGETLNQIIPVQHPDGADNAKILLAAFDKFKSIGGFVVDAEGGMDFYMASKLVGPIHFAIKQISLAGADALNGLKRGPQLVQ